MFYLKSVGYLRDILLAYYLGSGIISNIYITIQQICISFNNIINEGPVTSSFIPIYKKSKNQKNIADLFYTYSFSLFIVIAITILIFLQIFCTNINDYLFSDIKKINTLLLLRVSFFYIFFNIFISLFTAVLNSNFKFIFPSMISSLTNIFSILIIINYYNNDEHILYILCISLVISSIFQILLYLIFFKETRPNISKVDNKVIVKYKFNELNKNFFNNLVSINLFNILILALYIFSIIININQSYLYFSLRIVFLPIFFIGITIFFVTLPYLNELKIKNEFDKINDLINFSFQLILITSMPIIIFTFIFSTEIINFLLERGKFNNNDTIIVSHYLKILIFSAPATILSKLLLNIIYLYNKNEMAMKITLIIIFLFLIITLIFSNYINDINLLIFLTIITWLQVALLFFNIRKLIHINFNFLNYFFIILFSSFLSIFLIYLLKIYILELNIVINSLLFLVIYFSLIMYNSSTKILVKKIIFKN